MSSNNNSRSLEVCWLIGKSSHGKFVGWLIGELMNSDESS